MQVENPFVGASSASAVSEPVYTGTKTSGWSNFWDALTHPITMLSGLIKGQNEGVFEKYKDYGTWSAQDIINYSRNGTIPFSSDSVIGVNGSPVIGSSNPEASQDPSGYDQSQWDLDRTRELLAEQRAFNSAEAEKNREWQERMSNTAYQRAVEDLEKAGLNKWLAVTGGGNGASASTPSGSSASSQSGDVSTPNPYLAKAIMEFGNNIISSIIKLVK